MDASKDIKKQLEIDKQNAKSNKELIKAIEEKKKCLNNPIKK